MSNCIIIVKIRPLKRARQSCWNIYGHIRVSWGLTTKYHYHPHLQVSQHSRNRILTRMFTYWGWVVSQYPTYYTYSHSSTESSWMVPQYTEQARLMHLDSTKKIDSPGMFKMLVTRKMWCHWLKGSECTKSFPGQEDWTYLQRTGLAMSAGRRRLDWFTWNV